MVDWVQRNIPNCAAMMIYFKMIKVDISCIDESKTMLTGPENNLPIENAEKQLQGVYLYYDLNDRIWNSNLPQNIQFYHRVKNKKGVYAHIAQCSDFSIHTNSSVVVLLVDTDYSSNGSTLLWNNSATPIEVYLCDYIVQLIFEKIKESSLESVDSLHRTEDGGNFWVPWIQ